MTMHVSAPSLPATTEGAISAEQQLPTVVEALAGLPNQRHFALPDMFAGRSTGYVREFEAYLNATVPAYRFVVSVTELDGFTALRN